MKCSFELRMLILLVMVSRFQVLGKKVLELFAKISYVYRVHLEFL